MDWFLLFLILVLLALFLYQNGFCIAQSKLLFYPVRGYLAKPNYNIEEWTLKSGVRVWYVRQHPGAPTIFYCHGNAANMSYWNHMIDLIVSQQLNVCIFDYHGFGDTPGVPTPEAILRDAFETYDALWQRLPVEERSQLILWGESMGGPAALELANHRAARVLVLLSTFSTPERVVKNLGYSAVARFMARQLELLNNLAKAQRVKIPVVIMHSEEDELVPYDCATELLAAIPHDCKRLVTIAGPHARPKLSTLDLRNLLNFCDLSTSTCDAAAPHLEAICNDCRNFCALFPAQT